MLPEIRIASPCSADWEKMTGNDRQRFCAQCNKSVYNFSAMTAPEVEKLVAKFAGHLCARFYQRADGTMLTQDCPVGFRAKIRRVSRVAGAALSAAMGLSFAAAQNTPQLPSLVQIESAKDGVEIEVVDETGALIPGATVRLIGSDGRQESEGITGENGRLHFSRPPGKYLLLVSRLGFETREEPIEVPARARLQLKLQVAANLGVVVFTSEPSLIPIPSTLRDTQLSLPTTAPTLAVPPQRNRISRFFSAVGHKLGI